LELADRWILSRYQDTITKVTCLLEAYDLGEAGRLLYEFVWNEFCDWYIELAKKRLYTKGELGGGAEAAGGGSAALSRRYVAQTVLFEVLEGTLRLLHPFLPFLTEEIWQHLPEQGPTLMLQPWPRLDGYRDEELERRMEVLMSIIRAIRNIRAEVGVAPGRKTDVILICGDEQLRRFLLQAQNDLQQLAACEKIEILDRIDRKPPQSAGTALDEVEVFIPLRGLLDFDKEVDKVKKEIAGALGEEERLAAKLANPGFTEKAPPEVVAKEQEKLEAARGRIKLLRERLADLKDEET